MAGGLKRPSRPRGPNSRNCSAAAIMQALAEWLPMSALGCPEPWTPAEAVSAGMSRCLCTPTILPGQAVPGPGPCALRA